MKLNWNLLGGGGGGGAKQRNLLVGGYGYFLELHQNVIPGWMFKVLPISM